jgi:predicted nicotinamide N-methyase
MENFSLEHFKRRYETDETRIVVNGKRFTFLVPRCLEPFIDPENVFHDFPLWSKIWEASAILAGYLADRVPCAGQRILEIGAGLGLVGIVADAFGHEVTMTEYNADALEFARANAVVNHSGKLRVQGLDWRHPAIDGTFDLIVGSEIIYHERDFEPVAGLFRRYLRPGGEVILVSGIRKNSVEFFRRMQPDFEISAQKKVIRTQNEKIPVIFCRMMPRAVHPPASIPFETERSSSWP